MEQLAMEAPKTEVDVLLTSKHAVGEHDAAQLAKILTEKNGELQAKELWRLSGMSIEEFYLQLKSEIAHGWIDKPPIAQMKEIQAS